MTCSAADIDGSKDNNVSLGAPLPPRRRTEAPRALARCSAEVLLRLVLAERGRSGVDTPTQGRLDAMKVTITGGAGYIGSTLAEQLLAQATRSRVLDRLLHRPAGRRGRARGAGRRRHASATCATPPIAPPRSTGADALVHLAAIVGDPACARDPGARAMRRTSTRRRALIDDARRAGVRRLVFASTCSNYGRMSRPRRWRSTRPRRWRPVSLYAAQKVTIEQRAPERRRPAATCLRFATVYGAAARMRFDLTVNEFTRDLWAERPAGGLRRAVLAPYVHVARRGARRGARALEPPRRRRGTRLQRRPQRRELHQEATWSS